ncbi:MAG: hypothetical protein LBQ66_14395 [Planctomycetaceae bacterium]|nr:hypothetical protein [Planctomycetaceae bacterium]
MSPTPFPPPLSAGTPTQPPGGRLPTLCFWLPALRCWLLTCEIFLEINLSDYFGFCGVMF